MTDKLTEIKNIDAWYDEEYETIRVVVNMGGWFLLLCRHACIR